MKLNVEWLKEVLPKIPSSTKLCDKLTSIGLEVSNFKKSIEVNQKFYIEARH